MPYKNSDTTSSVVQQMGTWRHFTSSLNRLDTLKAGTVNINAPSISQIIGDGFAVNQALQDLGQKSYQTLIKWNKAYQQQQKADRAQQRAEQKHQYWRDTRQFDYISKVAGADKAVSDAQKARILADNARKDIPVEEAKRKLQLAKAQSQFSDLPLQRESKRAGYVKKILQAKAYEADYPYQRQLTINKLETSNENLRQKQQKKFYQQAKSLISKHGTSAFIQAISKGNILYDQNPVAIAGRSKALGQVTLGTYNTDFIADIENGKYNSSSVQNVLSEYTKGLRATGAQIAKQIGISQDDPAFTAGLYNDNVKNIIDVRQKFLSINNKNKSNETMTLKQGQFTKAVQDGATPQQLHNLLSNSLIIIPDSQSQNKLIDSAIDTIANSPNGYKVLDSFLSMEDPTTGMPLRSRLAEVSLADLRIKANNAYITANASMVNNLINGLQEVANKGNIEQLKNYKASILLMNGNVQDNFTKQIDKLIKKAQSVKASSIISQNKKAQNHIKQTNAQTYIRRLIGGQYLNNPAAYDTTQQITNNLFNSAVIAGTITPDDIMKGAANLSYFNPARTWINSFSKNILNNLNTQLQKGIVDKSYRFEQPQGLGVLLDMYSKNPAVFGNATSSLSDKNTLLLNQLLWLRSLDKLSFNDIMKSRVTFEQKIQKKPEFLQTLKKSCQKNLSDSDFDGNDYGYSQAVVLNSAMSNVQLGIKDTTTAINYGIAKFKEDHINVTGGWIPKWFLSFDNNLQPQTVAQFVQQTIKDRLSVFKNIDPKSDIFLVTKEDGIHIHNRYTALQFITVTPNQIKQAIQNYKKGIIERSVIQYANTVSKQKMNSIFDTNRQEYKNGSD